MRTETVFRLYHVMEYKCKVKGSGIQETGGTPDANPNILKHFNKMSLQKKLNFPNSEKKAAQNEFKMFISVLKITQIHYHIY